MVASIRSAWWTKQLSWFAVFSLSIGALLLHVPAPIKFARDPDWGHQLSGGNEILRGFHPTIDFSGFYGPLTFYASAAAQWLSGIRPLGEIFLTVLGYSLGYTMLFCLAKQATKRTWLAIACALTLIWAVPRMYKYYIVFCPALVLTAIWFYLERPSRIRLWIIGLSVAVSGLYRPDYGLYAMLASVICIVLEPGCTRRDVAVNFLYLCGAVLIWVSPWLIWVTVRGELGQYLFEASAGSAQQAVGQAGTLLPSFDTLKLLTVTNLVSGLQYFFYGMPIVGVALLAYRWHIVIPKERAQFAATTTLAFATLLQALQGGDFSHLLQAIPTNIFMITLMFNWAIPALLPTTKTVPRIIAGVSMIVSITGFLGLGAMAFPGWRTSVGVAPIPKLATYALQRDAFLDHLAASGNDDGRMAAMRFLKDCTSPNDKILAWPYLLSAYYLTDRTFGNRIMGFSPGFFSQPDQQQQTIRELADAKPPFWIYFPFAFSPNNQTMEDIYPSVTAYLRQNYVPVRTFGQTTIFVFREKQNDFACITHSD